MSGPLKVVLKKPVTVKQLEKAFKEAAKELLDDDSNVEDIPGFIIPNGQEDKEVTYFDLTEMKNALKKIFSPDEIDELIDELRDGVLRHLPS